MSSSLPLETFCFKGTEWSWTAGRGETGRGDSESDSVEEGLRARTEVCDQENEPMKREQPLWKKETRRHVLWKPGFRLYL